MGHVLDGQAIWLWKSQIAAVPRSRRFTTISLGRSNQETSPLATAYPPDQCLPRSSRYRLALSVLRSVDLASAFRFVPYRAPASTCARSKTRERPKARLRSG